MPLWTERRYATLERSRMGAPRYHRGMRVIAGLYRSRRLAAPAGMATRPTSDRLRETLASMLAPRLPGARMLDLYAGSGAVGIEALSRGAAFVWFAEKAPSAVHALRGNLVGIGIAAQDYAMEPRGVAVLLRGLIDRPPVQNIDLVYLDPPYDAAEEYAATLGLLGSERGRALLAPDAWVVAEHDKKRPLAESYGALTLLRTRVQGDACLSFYGLAAVASGQDSEQEIEPTV
jgi:16S rRNA (guanine966-N2)-methyltransferase